jgi:hypothetical protein
MTDTKAALYEDPKIQLDSEGLTIRSYYPWGAKRIRYVSIRSVQQLQLTGMNAVRKWRIWGSGDLLHWWNLDGSRPEKHLALVLDVGRHIRPTITPDDPAAVEQILADRIRTN